MFKNCYCATWHNGEMQITDLIFSDNHEDVVVELKNRFGDHIKISEIKFMQRVQITEHLPVANEETQTDQPLGE